MTRAWIRLKHSLVSLPPMPTVLAPPGLFGAVYSSSLALWPWHYLTSQSLSFLKVEALGWLYLPYKWKYTVVSPYPEFQFSVVNCGPKILIENSRNKPISSFKLHADLSSMIKSQDVLLHLTWDVNYRFVQRLHAKGSRPVSHLVALSVIRVAVWE